MMDIWIPETEVSYPIVSIYRRTFRDKTFVHKLLVDGVYIVHTDKERRALRSSTLVFAQM